MINNFTDLFAYWQRHVDDINRLLENPFISDGTRRELQRDQAQYEQTAHQVKTLLDRQSNEAARELTAAQGVPDDKYRRALQVIHDFAEEGATHWEWAVARVAREALGIPGGSDENDDA